MAVLAQNNNAGSGLNLEHEAPAGQYIATCVDIIDLFGVERQKFQSQETALRDVTRFVFGVYTPDRKLFLIQTYEFTISTAPGSNLMKFLKSWIGAEPPMGWDYCALKGTPAAITVEVKASKRNPAVLYASISGIGPIFPQMANMVAPAAAFDQLLAEARVRQNQKAQPQAPVTGARPPQGYQPAAPVAPAPAAPPAPAPYVPPVQAQPPLAPVAPAAPLPGWPAPAAPVAPVAQPPYQPPVAAPVAPAPVAPVPGASWTPPAAAPLAGFPPVQPVAPAANLPF